MSTEQRDAEQYGQLQKLLEQARPKTALTAVNGAERRISRGRGRALRAT